MAIPMTFRKYFLALALIFTSCAVNTRWYEQPKVDRNYKGDRNKIRDRANESLLQCKAQFEATFKECKWYNTCSNISAGYNVISGIAVGSLGITTISQDSVNKSLAWTTTALGAGTLINQGLMSGFHIADKKQLYCSQLVEVDSIMLGKKNLVDIKLQEIDREVRPVKRDSMLYVINGIIDSISQACK